MAKAGLMLDYSSIQPASLKWSTANRQLQIALSDWRMHPGTILVSQPNLWHRIPLGSPQNVGYLGEQASLRL